MKNKNRFTVLGIIFTALVIFFIGKDTLLNLVTKPNQKPFESIKNADFKEIILQNAISKTVLKNNNNKWQVVNNKQTYVASPDRVTALLIDIQSFSTNEIASNNKDKHSQLGIEKNKLEFVTDKLKQTIYIGNPVTEGTVYARLGDEPNVYVISGFLDTFSQIDYRDLKIPLIGQENKVTEISYKYSDGNKLLLNKTNDGWKLNGKKIVQEKMSFIINDLSTLKASDIQPRDTTLTKPQITILIKEDTTNKTLQIFKQDATVYFLTIDKKPDMYIIDSVAINSLTKNEKDFIE